MPPVRVSKSTLWKAIRSHCLWCCGGPDFKGAFVEVRECPSDHCPLYPFRSGKPLPPDEKVQNLAPVGEKSSKFEREGAKR